MENRFELALEMEITPSVILKRYLQIVHVLAMLALLWPMDVVLPLRILLLLLCLSSYFYSSRKYIDATPVTALAWRRRGEWSVRNRAGEWAECSLHGEVLLLSWIVVMKMKTAQGKNYPLLLLKDCMDADLYRHLRIRVSGETA